MIKIHQMMRFFFERLVLRHPGIVILCFLAVVCFLSFQARHFRLDASSETLMLEDDEDLRYSRLISSRYGQHTFLILTYSPRGDLLSEETLAALGKLRDELKSLDHVTSVLSILDVPLFGDPSVSLKEVASGLPTLESETVDKDLARVELSESGLYRNMLVSSDLRTTVLMIYFPDDEVYKDLQGERSRLRQKRSSGSLSSAEKLQLRSVTGQFRQHKDEMRKLRRQDIIAVREIMDRYRADAELFLGGVGMITNDMITFIKNDLKKFGVGVLFLLVVTLGAIFRRKRWVLLPLLICVFSALCMIGLLGWFGWEVTVVSSNFISLQLIMTLAIVIHLIVRYRELLVENPDAPNRELIFETIRLKMRPCVYAVLTTIAGFGSLVFCNILPVITFGWMMIAGLVVSLIVTFLLFPAVLVLLPKEKLPRVPGRRFSMTSMLAGFTERHGVLIISGSFIIFIVSLIGISKLQVENSFIDYFDETTEIYQGMKVIDQQLGGTTSLDITIDFEDPVEIVAESEGDTTDDDDFFDEFEEYDQVANDDKYWFTSDKMSRVKRVHRYLDELDETGKVLSMATVLDIAETMNDGKALDSLELALLNNEAPEDMKNLLIGPYVSVEHNQVRFWVRVRDSEETLRRNELIKRIRRDMTDVLGFEQEQVHLSGMLVLYNNMLQSLFSSQVLTLGITVLVLTLMFFVLFKSLKIALIAMLPNILPISVVLGVIGWLKIPLDMMTITIAAISVGIAVDNTIHYIHRFRNEIQKDGDYLKTMHRCHGSIGHAMHYTSLTIIIGFSILAMSNFVPTVCFGLLTGLSMLIALLADLTFLPRMLILTKPFNSGDLP